MSSKWGVRRRMRPSWSEPARAKESTDVVVVGVIEHRCWSDPRGGTCAGGEGPARVRGRVASMNDVKS
jgi:hypothetical protein